MTHQPTGSAHDTPGPESRTQSTEERDTLNDTPELRFLRDEIEALLGPSSVRRPVRDVTVDYETSLSPAEAAMFDRDTEPSIDVRLIREAMRAAGK